MSNFTSLSAFSDAWKDASITAPSRRASVTRYQQKGPARPAVKRQDSHRNTSNNAQLKRQDTAGSTTAGPGARRGAQAGSVGPAGAFKRQDSGLRRNSVDKISSALAESQAVGSSVARYIGVISAKGDFFGGFKLKISPPEPDRDFFAESVEFEAGSTFEIGQHVYQRFDFSGQYFTRASRPTASTALKRQEPGLKRTSISETPALTYVGKIDAQGNFWLDEASVSICPPAGKHFILKSERFEGGVKLHMGVHVYERPDGKYVTRATGPQ